MKKTREQISFNMSRVKNKDSVIETSLRRALWRRGLRYRKNDPGVYGRPDVSFRGAKIAVFCDSEFWHGFEWEKHRDDFKSRRDFWIAKIERNMARDVEVNRVLRDRGWTVLRFWGKAVSADADACARAVEVVVREKLATLNAGKLSRQAEASPASICGNSESR